MEQVEEQNDPFLLVVDDPITGLLPWLAWGLLTYIWSPVVCAVISLVLALALLLIAWGRGERPKPLEASDVATFVVVLVIALFAGEGLTNWMEDHADLVANSALTLLAFISLATNRPFTAPYTEARFPGLDEGLQYRLDRVSTAAWGIGLAVAAFVAWYGEYVLDNPNDFWTGWTLQLLPLVLAYHATLWFDRRAIAKQLGDPNLPSIWGPIGTTVIWLAPIGVIAVMVNDAPLWFGEALFWAGLGLGLLSWGLLRRRSVAQDAPEIVFGEEG